MSAARSSARSGGSDACREAALSLLDSRPYTRKRLEEKLRARKYPLQTIRAVLDDLERLGLLNDLEYARAYVEHATGPHARALGSRKIIDNLIRRGVPRPIAEQAVAEFANASAAETGMRETDWELARAVEAAQTRWRRILRETPAPGPRERARLFRFLASRGFSSETVYEAVRRVTDTPIDEATPDDPAGA